MEADRRDLYLLMDHLGMLPAPAGLRDEDLPRRVFREALYLETDRDGLWTPAVGPDVPVKQGDLLGTVEDIFGDKLFELRAPCDGHVLYVYTGLAAPKGEFLVACAVAGSEVR